MLRWRTTVAGFGYDRGPALLVFLTSRFFLLLGDGREKVWRTVLEGSEGTCVQLAYGTGITARGFPLLRHDIETFSR